MSSAPELLTRAPAPPVRVLSLGQGTDMVADLWSTSATPKGTVVMLHGGFWREHIDRAHTSHMGQALADEGWLAISVEYPRTPGNPDRTHQAVQAALTELLQSGITATGPTVLLGHSAGGQLALWATAAQLLPFTRVVALAPVTSLEQAEEQNLGEGAVRSFLGEPAGSRPDLDPYRLATPSVPTLIIHGEQDQRVPVEMSRTYVSNRPEVQLHTLPLADHFDLIDPQSAHWPAVRNALHEAASPEHQVDLSDT